MCMDDLDSAHIMTVELRTWTGDDDLLLLLAPHLACKPKGSAHLQSLAIPLPPLLIPQVINTCTHHQKAVYGFVWCSAYSIFASCGVERDVILWQVGRTLCATTSLQRLQD